MGFKQGLLYTPPPPPPAPALNPKPYMTSLPWVPGLWFGFRVSNRGTGASRGTRLVASLLNPLHTVHQFPRSQGHPICVPALHDPSHPRL